MLGKYLIPDIVDRSSGIFEVFLFAICIVVSILYERSLTL